MPHTFVEALFTQLVGIFFQVDLHWTRYISCGETQKRRIRTKMTAHLGPVGTVPPRQVFTPTTALVVSRWQDNHQRDEPQFLSVLLQLGVQFLRKLIDLLGISVVNFVLAVLRHKFVVI